ncbi:MAG: hypothetical protein HYS61_04975 [Acidobacteria bacterium]|nr:hypothetical protein [Acidobacteriota bacterium]
MKTLQAYLVVSAFVISACSASVSWAQASAPTIRGSGTTGSLPVFTSPTTIGNSEAFQLDGNIGIGTTTPGQSGFSDAKLEAQSSSEAPFVSAVFGLASGSGEFTAGVRGYATAEIGQTSGVVGVSFSANGFGVHGNNLNPEGGNGVLGLCEATGGFCVGVAGAKVASTGFGFGGQFETFSPEGGALLLNSFAGGNLIVGQVGALGRGSETPVFRVDGTGKVFANGGFAPRGADFAESMPVSGDRGRYEPGDLLVIDVSGERRLALSNNPYSPLVAGIHSTKPGILASPHQMDDPHLEQEVPLAIVGIVPCKVTAENGQITAGDLLVSSSTPGHAMKGTDHGRMLGAIVGKALEPLREGSGVIQVLVTLQ